VTDKSEPYDDKRKRSPGKPHRFFWKTKRIEKKAIGRMNNVKYPMRLHRTIGSKKKKGN